MPNNETKSLYYSSIDEDVCKWNNILVNGDEVYNIYYSGKYNLVTINPDGTVKSDDSYNVVKHISDNFEIENLIKIKFLKDTNKFKTINGKWLVDSSTGAINYVVE